MTKSDIGSPERAIPAPIQLPGLTLVQVAAALGRDYSTVRRAVAKGKIKTFRDLDRVFVEPAELKRVIAERAERRR
jgi:hypothetical protein